MRDRLTITGLALSTAALPAVASAQALSRVAGVFHVVVGLMLVAACLLYGTGMILWFTRLGVWPSYRDEAIEILQWAVAVMFTLIIVLTAVRLIQAHIAAASFLFGVSVVLVVIWFIIKMSASSGEEENEH